ncbi:transcriptional regulator family: Helix-turn-helix [Paecilomyces variotii]|nr:transcriptional regulator family: Helix-turn-helix [Paecilomyces variotii]
MPPKQPKSSKNCVEQEGRLLLAIQALKENQIPSVRKAASVFNVPRSTLQSRLQGHQFRGDIPNHASKLTEAQQQSLVQWILSMDRRGASPRPTHVREMASLLVDQDSEIQLGKNWASTFIRRRPELRTVYSRRYTYQRAKCEDPKIIKPWFNTIQVNRLQFGIADEDIYNFDETGYAMDLTATAKVVTRAEYYGKRQVIQPGNREWVTSIECVNAMGWALSPCIIFKGKTHMQAWYEDPNLPKDWRIEISDNGWTTDKIGIRWLQNVFIPQTARRSAGGYRLLILDGHGSHLTPEFDKLCSENNIIPLCMPPHSSAYCQPLDVSCFGPLKAAYGRLVQEKQRRGFNHIDKVDFLSIYPGARTQAFSSATIKNGFRATGIVPFNPEEVLGRFTIQLETPTPPGTQSTASSISLSKTPRNRKDLEKHRTMIQSLLRRRTQSPAATDLGVLDRFIQRYECLVSEKTLMTQEIRDLRSANEELQQKKQRSTRQMGPIQGLSVEEGQALIQRNQEATEAPINTVEGSETAPVQRRQRAPPQCTNCGVSGHIRTRCPN